MCQAAVGRVISLSKDGMTVEYNGKRRALKSSRLLKVKPGDYVQFSLDIAIDKIDKEEAEMILKGMK